VQAGDGSGRVTMRALAEGLRPATLIIPRVARTPRVQVAVTPAVLALDDWRRSPVLADRPDPTLAPADGDNNSWAFVHSATPTPAEANAGWRVYRTRFTPWKRVAAEGGEIRFDAVGGRAELWVDGVKAAEKADAGIGPIRAAVPAGAGPRSVALLVQAPAGAPSGLLGKVAVAAR
jgi:beta-galactosidase